MKIWQKIKQAFSIDPGPDSSSYPTGKCGYNRKTALFTRLLPYGLSSLEPTGSFVLLFNSQGQEAVKFGMPSAMQNRMKSLKEGEVAIYNSKTNTYVILNQDGAFTINCSGLIDGDVEITGNAEIAGDVIIGGALAVGGTLNVSGATTMSTVACNSISVNGLDFSSHVHQDANPEEGDTGGPK